MRSVSLQQEVPYQVIECERDDDDEDVGEFFVGGETKPSMKSRLYGFGHGQIGIVS